MHLNPFIFILILINIEELDRLEISDSRKVKFIEILKLLNLPLAHRRLVVLRFLKLLVVGGGRGQTLDV